MKNLGLLALILFISVVCLTLEALAASVIYEESGFGPLVVFNTLFSIGFITSIYSLLSDTRR